MSSVQISTLGERLTMTWKEARITFTFDRWRSEKETITAEVTITTAAPGYNPHLTAGRLNLTSLTTRHQWATRLSNLYAEADWTTLLEEGCLKALMHYRGGEPAQRLTPTPLGAGPTWRVQPLLYEKLPTVLFGPGGSRKSFLALWISLLIEKGMAMDSMMAVQGRALYLDWESDVDIAAYRMGRFIDGNPVLAGASPLYRRMKQPLASDLPALSTLIAEENITALIIDSLGMACGGKDLADPSTAIAYFSALRSLPVTSLSIAHVPKNSDNPSIYGSVFFSNIARMTWEIKCQTDAETGTSTVGLFNRKANERTRPPVGLEFVHDPQTQAITVNSTTITDAEMFLDSASLTMQIRHYLQDGAKTSSALAILIRKPLASIVKALQRAEQKGQVIQIGEGKGSEWVLPPIATTEPDF